jgi:hypothetical protein
VITETTISKACCCHAQLRAGYNKCGACQSGLHQLCTQSVLLRRESQKSHRNPNPPGVKAKKKWNRRKG